MLKKFGIQFVLISFLCLSLTTFAFAKEATPNTISVQGTSSIEVTPDQASITFSVLTSAQTADSARSENALTVTKLKLQLTELGIEEDSMKTTQYSMQPLYKYDDKGQNPELTGYQVIHDISVVVKDLALTGRVIDTALTAGANKVEDIRFQKKDQSSLETKILALAAKDAQVKAEAIATALGKQVINVISVNVGNMRLQDPEKNHDLLLKGAALRIDTPVFAGTMTMQGTVNIVFEIQ